MTVSLEAPGLFSKAVLLKLQDWGSCSGEGASCTGGGRGDVAVLTSSRVVLMLTPLAQDQVAIHHPSPPEEHPWPPFSSHLPRTAQVKGTFILGQLLVSGTCVRHCSQAQGASDQQNIESRNVCQKQDWDSSVFDFVEVFHGVWAWWILRNQSVLLDSSSSKSHNPARDA